MMSLRNFISKLSLIIMIFFFIIFISCSDYGLGEFEDVVYEPYTLNTVLDDFPALKDLVYSLTLNEVSKGQVKLIYTNEEAYQNTKDDIRNLVLHENHPVQDAIPILRKVLKRILEQDTTYSRENNTRYTETLFSYIDRVREEELGIASDLLEILKSMACYDLDVYGTEKIEEYADEAIEEMKGPEYAEDLEYLIRDLSKMLIQTSTTMKIDENGDLVAGNGEGARDLGLGNSSRGAALAIAALAEFPKDEVLWSIIKELIREVGNVVSSNIKDGHGNDLYIKDIIKKKMEVERQAFTEGGSSYFHTDNSDKFESSDSQVTSLFGTALNMGLFLRSDREGALISSVDPGKSIKDPNYASDKKYKNYYLDLLVKNLKKIDFDPDEHFLEESVYDLIRHDTFGRDRVTDKSAWPVSFLEQFLFLNGTATHSGWKDGGKNGEITSGSDPNMEHGHGEYANGITINDSLFAIGGHETLGINTYGLAFNNVRNKVFRSKDYFHRDERENYKFGYSSNYYAQRMMSGFGPADIGTPIGGNPAPGGDYNNADDLYVPFNPDGFGDDNAARFLLYWMIRSCWNGEGPYYYDPSKKGQPVEEFSWDGKIWQVFYRPNGQIYCLKNKENPAEFLYPSDGDDPEDQDTEVVHNGRKQRYNRYRDVWYSDYYLMVNEKIPFQGDKFCSPDDMSGNAEGAARIRFDELISEENPIRACSSQVEAIFRNFQWLVAEKKMAIVVPMALQSAVAGIGHVFQIIEGNGVAGLTHCRLSQPSDEWKLAGHSESMSIIPGDYRMRFLFGDFSLVLSLKMVLDSLDKGTAQPGIITHNVPGIYRFAFPRSQKNFANANDYGLLGSQDFEIDESDENWNRRNGLLPVIVTALGTLMDNQNRDFYDPANREKTLMRMTQFSEALMGMIMPRFYFKKNQFGDGAYSPKSWIPKIQGYGSGAWLSRFLKRTHEITGSDENSVYGGEQERNYYQPVNIRTPLNSLYDEDLEDPNRRCVGLLPMITAYDTTGTRGENNSPKTRLVTRAVKMLLQLGDEKFDDPEGLSYSSDGFEMDYENWGTRRKLFYALEQIESAKRFTKSDALKMSIYKYDDNSDGDGIDSSGTAKIKLPSWIFAEPGADLDGDGRPDSYNNIRMNDIVVDENMYMAMDRLIGKIDDSDPKKWETFDRNFDKMGDILSDNGTTSGKYNILEKGLSILDSILTKVDPPNVKQAEALVHTLGTIISPYDRDRNDYIIKDQEFVTLLTDYLVKIKEVPKGHRAWKAKAGLSDLTKGGTIYYVVNTLESQYPTGELVEDFYGFLGQDLILDPYSPFWEDVPALVEDMAEEIIRNKDFDPDTFLNNIGFEYTGGLDDFWNW